MKQLFVINNKEKKKKKEHQDIFLCCERKEEKNEINEISPILNITENHLNHQVLNSSANSTTNSSTDSRKISESNFFSESKNLFNSNISINTTNDLNSQKLNKYLGKKSKILFNIIKNEDIKEGNPISLSNFHIFNNPSVYGIDQSIMNKEIINNESLELKEENLSNNTLNNNANNKCKKEKNKAKKRFLNEGRWSFKEHIKFIEAIAEYGKNWSDVQKYVGSRSTSQTRSHAQKFCMKLKAIKNNKFNFDFNNIKNICDIIEIIKRKDEYITGGKDYIINTLINLSESITYENLDLSKNIDNNIKTTKLNIKRKKERKEETLLNNNKELKFGLFNVFKDTDFKNDNESKSKQNIITNNLNKHIDKIEDNEKKQDNNNIIQDKNLNNQNNEEKTDKIKSLNNQIIEYKSEINESISNNKIINNNINNNKDILIKKNINNDINIHYNENDIKNNEKEICNNFIDEPKPQRQKYIFDDGIIYLAEDSEFFNMNNISLKLKNYYYLKNYESPNFLYNKYFFS